MAILFLFKTGFIEESVVQLILLIAGYLKIRFISWNRNNQNFHYVIKIAELHKHRQQYGGLPEGKGVGGR